MKKYILCSLALVISLLLFTGCNKEKEITYEERDDLKITEYICEEGWELENNECVNGTMPTIGDGCEEGTTDRIGDDGFCHHYKDAIIKYSCKDDAILKDNKCYVEKK